MTTGSPRLNPPERLSGVPIPPEIEIAPGRPWLTVEETNRLIRQQGLSWPWPRPGSWMNSPQ